MGTGIFLENFDGKGQALLVSGAIATEHDSYMKDAIAHIQDSGYEYHEVMTMGKGEIEDNFMSYDQWCISLWDGHTGAVNAIALDAAREILGEKLEKVLSDEYDRTSIPEDFTAIGIDGTSNIAIAVTGWQHDQVIAVYNSKAIEDNPYYIGYDKEEILAGEAQRKVLDNLVPVQKMQAYEQAQIDAVFENIRSRLQEALGDKEVYKASGGYMASFFDPIENHDLYALEQKQKFDSAVNEQKNIEEAAKQLNTEETVQVCKQVLDFFYVQERASVVYLDTTAAQAILVPYECSKELLRDDHLEEFGRLDLPEGWQSWDGITEALKQASGNSIIELPDHGQALTWANTTTVDNVSRYNKGYEASNEHRYLYSPGIVREAGFGSDWDLNLIRLQNLHSADGLKNAPA